MKHPASPPPDADPVGWFFRLERAVRESDFLIANEARRQLRRLGWIVAHKPVLAKQHKTERPALESPRGTEGSHA